MKVIELELTNFKGVRNLTLHFDGRDARIVGANGTGKSTVMDGWIWLLTGKDHLGRSDLNFSIKTLDENGEVIPMIDHSVRAVVEHDGVTFELARTFKEVWQKKTGTNVQSFNGHKTEYSIDGVPKSEKEYTAFIERLAPMKLICLLSMSGYFNEQMKWEDRRRMLLDMCGDVNEAEMLALPEWSELSPYTSKLVSVADLKKARTAQKSKINDEIKAIPIQINTHSQYIRDDLPTVSVVQGAIDTCNAEIDRLTADKSALTSGEGIANLRRKLAELEAEKVKAASSAREKRDAAERDKRDRLRDAQDKLFALESEKKRLLNERDDLNRQLTMRVTLKDAALKKYYDLDAQEFAGDPICPTCGQAFPAEHMQAVMEQFNETKAKNLEATVAEGKKLATEISDTQKRNDAITARLDSLADEVAGPETEVEAIQAEISAPADSTAPYDDSAILAKKAEIENFNASISDKAAKIDSDLSAVKAQKSSHEQNLAAIRNAENAAWEIKKLKAREKELAGAYEDCERIIALCDDFTSARVKMLDDKISGAFRYARFKLTETLVNGGMKEICETLVGGVPYSAANTAAKVQISCDIIRTFQEHYDCHLPLFIDSRESVSVLPNMDCQMISLVVPTPFDSLPDYFKDYMVERDGSEEQARAEYEEPYKTLKLEVV